MKPLRLFIVSKILNFIPETRAFAFKRCVYKWAGVNIGNEVRICSSAKILGNGNLTIHNNTWIGPGVVIICSWRITIGANCDIAPGVYIGDGTHELTPSGERIAGVEKISEIVIGDGCWLCVNATILPGVTIGKKCVVAAGAVVTSDSDDMMLIAGVPAIVKKNLDNV